MDPDILIAHAAALSSEGRVAGLKQALQAVEELRKNLIGKGVVFEAFEAAYKSVERDLRDKLVAAEAHLAQITKGIVE